MVKWTVAKIAVDQVTPARALYRDLLGLGVVMDHDWPSRQLVLIPAQPYFTPFLSWDRHLRRASLWCHGANLSSQNLPFLDTFTLIEKPSGMNQNFWSSLTHVPPRLSVAVGEP